MQKIKESVRTGYTNNKEMMLRIPIGSYGPPDGYRTFQRRCEAVEEVFRNAGKPLEALSAKGDTSGTSVQSSSGGKTVAALLIIAVLAVGAGALYFFLNGRNTKPTKTT